MLFAEKGMPLGFSEIVFINGLSRAGRLRPEARVEAPYRVWRAKGVAGTSDLLQVVDLQSHPHEDETPLREAVWQRFFVANLETPPEQRCLVVGAVSGVAERMWKFLGVSCLNFGFVSDFRFQISDFKLPAAFEQFRLLQWRGTPSEETLGASVRLSASLRQNFSGEQSIGAARVIG